MTQLPIHLEWEQYIVFNHNHPEQIRNQTNTHLTAFFKVNQQWPEACEILYPDFPSKFTWDNSHKIWYRRKGGKETLAGEWYMSPQMLAKSFTLNSFYHM